MRVPIIAANWKMNITPSQAVNFVKEFETLVRQVSNTEIVLCPSACAIESTKRALQNPAIKTGAQNIYFEEKGAFTGETSLEMIKDLGCEYVILGHSERRTLFAESNEMINKKVKKSIQQGLKPILCIGELLTERESGKTEAVVSSQLEGSLKDLDAASLKDLVIAYEPVWAIGTGVTASPEQAEDAHRFIREWLSGKFGSELAESTRIQYGGSVKPDNARELMNKPNIDGALVGGASLVPSSFAAIITHSTN